MHRALDWYTHLIACLRETASPPRAAMAQSVASNNTMRTAKGSRLHNGLKTTKVVMIAFAISMPQMACIEKCHHLCPVGFIKGRMRDVEARSMFLQMVSPFSKTSQCQQAWRRRENKEYKTMYSSIN